jgi:ketosteroid isomerase-like protein
MWQENVEIVRRTIDLFNAGEIHRAMEQVRDDFEVDWSNSIGPHKGIYRGRSEALRLWRSFVEAFDALHWDPEEIIEVDEARVIVVNHVRMRGRDSGVDVDAMGAQLWTITGGKAQRLKLYQSKADALETAGLSE